MTIELDPNTIRFYRVNRSHGFLSNLYPAEIEFEGRKFPSSEYAYQFGKYRDEKPKEKEIREWAMSAPTGSLVAQLSHSLLGWQIKSDWAKVKVDRMRAVLKAKFTQHEVLKNMLLSTNSYPLVEMSKTDSFWGVGKKGTGKNMLGKLLMELRSELRKYCNYSTTQNNCCNCCRKCYDCIHSIRPAFDEINDEYYEGGCKLKHDSCKHCKAFFPRKSSEKAFGPYPDINENSLKKIKQEN